jgi:hypothetical protein
MTLTTFFPSSLVCSELQVLGRHASTPAGGLGCAGNGTTKKGISSLPEERLHSSRPTSVRVIKPSGGQHRGSSSTADSAHATPIAASKPASCTSSFPTENLRHPRIALAIKQGRLPGGNAISLNLGVPSENAEFSH